MPRYRFWREEDSCISAFTGSMNMWPGWGRAEWYEPSKEARKGSGTARSWTLTLKGPAPSPLKMSLLSGRILQAAQRPPPPCMFCSVLFPARSSQPMMQGLGHQSGGQEWAFPLFSKCLVPPGFPSGAHRADSATAGLVCPLKV